MAKVKILVVDDEEEICSLTKSFLSKRDFDVFTATTEGEALRIINKEDPKLILLDLCLGGASGIDILEKIRQVNQKVRVVMVTGLEDEQSMLKARSLGAGEFIRKPFSVDFLDELVSRNTKD